MKLTLVDLEKALIQSRCKETCYEPDQHLRTGVNPAFGQCYITSLIVQDYFGGEIVKTKLESGIGHYRNAIEGEEIDLTRSQFINNEVIPTPIKVSRYDMEENDRYHLLKQKVENIL